MSIRREIENKLINEINKDLRDLCKLFPKILYNKENLSFLLHCIELKNKWKTKLWEGMVIKEEEPEIRLFPIPNPIDNLHGRIEEREANKNGRFKSETPQVQNESVRS